MTGRFDAFEHSEAALAEKVAFLRAAARERFASIELHHGLYPVIITQDRERAAAELARRREPGVAAEQILASPFMFVGTVEQLVDTLQRQRDQCGISYLTVLFRDMEDFAPVVARLAGT